jgi:ADP-ribose pyrophosphatase YjhB (NUDIX family)
MSEAESSPQPPAFYRVAGKAIIRDAEGRVLVVADNSGTYELPGGGWEHDEDFETCLTRELKEELGAEVTEVGDVLFYYRGRGVRGHVMLRIAAQVELASHEFTLDEDEVTEARFVDREAFLTLNWCSEDREVTEHVGKLWPPVEKDRKNR